MNPASPIEFWMHGIGEFVAWSKINRMFDDPKETPYFLESEILSPYAALKPDEDYMFHYEAWFKSG